MRASGPLQTNVLVVVRRTPEEKLLDLDPAQVARKLREQLAHSLLAQLCAPAGADAWKDALFAGRPELVDIVNGQFVGIHKPLSVALQDDGQALIRVEDGFFDATPLVTLAEALTPHAPGVARKLLEVAVAGALLPGERMKLADAMSRDHRALALETATTTVITTAAITTAAGVADTSHTALHRAAAKGDLQAVQAVLSTLAPGQIDAARSDGATALLVAAGRGRLKIVGLLLTHGANPHSRLDDGSTALRWAAQNGHTAVVKLLLAHFTSAELVNLPAKNGGTALTAAAGHGHLEILKLLLAKGADPGARFDGDTSPLYLAAQNGHTEVVKLLLARAPDQLNLAGKSGCTPLLAASLNGHAGTAKLLLAEPGIDVHARRTSDGATALFMAAAHGHLEIVTAFIARPDKFDLVQMVDPRKPQLKGDHWGATPISIAAENGRLEVVKALQSLTRASESRPHRVPLIVTDDSRCWSLVGHDFIADDSILQSAIQGGTRDIELNFLGRGIGVQWDEFTRQTQAPGVAGTRWFIQAHGSAWSKDEPRHRLTLVDGQKVGTTELIRMLVKGGVRKIEVWSCYAKQFLEYLALRMENDPGWPQMHEPLEVCAIGEEHEESITALSKEDKERVLYGLAHPDQPSAAAKLSVVTRTTLRFDPNTRKVTVETIPAPDLDGIAARLPSLTAEEQKYLVCSYMAKCCVLGKADELERAIKRFPQLADVNYKPRHSPRDLVSLASYGAHLNIVECLVKQPGIRLDGNGGVAPLRAAASKGNDQIIEFLLRHGVPITAAAIAAATKAGKRSTIQLLGDGGPKT